MKLKYDLHIHSGLSQCGDVLMSPNNILNVCSMVGLDLISITDHNSCLQLDVIFEIAESFDFVVIPGIEVSVEGFHVLVYFKTLEYAKSFSKDLEKYLISNDKKYDEEYLFDVYDLVKGLYDKPLIDTTIKYDEFYELAKKYEGLIILAHIDRMNTSCLKKYKLSELRFDGIEITSYADKDFYNQYKDYKILTNSDSHSLIEIRDENNEIELESKSIEGFFRYFYE